MEIRWVQLKINKSSLLKKQFYFGILNTNVILYI